MNDEGNPAGRLHQFFEAVASHDRTRPACEQLCLLWGLSFPEDWPTALDRLRRLQDDVGDMTARLAELDDPAGNVNLARLGHLAEVLRNYTANTSNSLAALADPADGSVRLALESASAILNHRWRDPLLPEDTINNLLENLAAVVDQVTGADDLDRMSKTWLLRRFQEIINALQDYKVNGYETFERATNELIGGLHGKPGLVSRIAQSATAQGIGIVLTLLSQTIQTASAVKELTAAPETPQIVQILELEVQHAQAAIAGQSVSDAATLDEPEAAQP